LTDKIDFGYIKRWDKVTSLLYDYESGEFVDGTPVILSTPINMERAKIWI
jgi:hypothetical protein